MSTLCEAWEWCESDLITHCLPLHHIHGIVNALYCPLHVGAAVDLLPKFSPTAVWQRIIVRGAGGGEAVRVCDLLPKFSPTAVWQRIMVGVRGRL